MRLLLSAVQELSSARFLFVRKNLSPGGLTLAPVSERKKSRSSLKRVPKSNFSPSYGGRRYDT